MKPLAQLGYESGVFLAKFPGKCGITGIKILVGDKVSYYKVSTYLLEKKVCLVIAINFHIWFPSATLGPDDKISILKRLELERLEANQISKEIFE